MPRFPPRQIDEKGKAVSDEEMSTLSIEGDDFHPEWSYTITPRFVGSYSNYFYTLTKLPKTKKAALWQD